MNLPTAVGSRIAIPTWDHKHRREAEAHGFWPESGTPQYVVMRRDFPEGMLVTGPRRPCPREFSPYIV